MKQLIMTLMIALMSVMASTPVSAKSNKSELKKSIPTNLIVKQTTQFSDGRTLVIYYKKQGMNCEVYSPCNADDYSNDHVRKSVSDYDVNTHEVSVKEKSDKPDYQVGCADFHSVSVFLQNEVVCNLNCNHRCKN